ncbi:MAG: hypothetical protein LBB98_06280 [Treponema sp.]|jgi:hypothetical protein|nr:hypothetical protein [Treponema sp.]
MEKEITRIVARLNEKGKWIALQQIKAIQEAYPKEREDPAPKRRLTDEELRCILEKELTDCLRLEGYILVGWRLGNAITFDKPTNGKARLDPGKCAYLPVSGDRWIYVWEFHGEYAGAEDERRFIYVVENNRRPERHQRIEVLHWFDEPAPEQYTRYLPRKHCWVRTVPLFLFGDGKDWRPRYLAGDCPMEIEV